MRRNWVSSFTHICLAAQVNQVYLGRPGMWQNAEQSSSVMLWNSVSLAEGSFISLPNFPSALTELSLKSNVRQPIICSLLWTHHWNLRPRGQQSAGVPWWVIMPAFEMQTKKNRWMDLNGAHIQLNLPTNPVVVDSIEQAPLVSTFWLGGWNEQITLRFLLSRLNRILWSWKGGISGSWQLIVKVSVERDYLF